MSYIQKYPLLPPLPKIERHDQLPEDSVIIGQLLEGDQNDDPLYLFIKRDNFLSIIITMRITGEVKITTIVSSMTSLLRCLAGSPRRLPISSVLLRMAASMRGQ